MLTINLEYLACPLPPPPVRHRPSPTISLPPKPLEMGSEGHHWSNATVVPTGPFGRVSPAIVLVFSASNAPPCCCVGFRRVASCLHPKYQPDLVKWVATRRYQ